jgi:hypothetical protein
VYLVLLVSLRALDVSGGEVSLPESFAAWALVRVLQQIAITHTRIGMTDEAAKTYRQVLERDANAAGAHYGLAFLLLTTLLPNRGNGSYTLQVYAEDVEGRSTYLGSRTITCTNATATKPFGAIDTPGQGATISGTSYMNFGWALTPPPGDSAHGSTIRVFVDGAPLGPDETTTGRTSRRCSRVCEHEQGGWVSGPRHDDARGWGAYDCVERDRQ